MILAIGTVLPFMMKICNKVAFTYEVNDDAAIVQILDGSYTGTPDGHAIFIKYPLSWIIAKLYELNPKLPFTVPADNGICKKRGTVETVEFTLSWYFRNVGILYEKTVLLYGHSIFAD